MSASAEVTNGVKCPFREDHEVEGLLCFDPWLDEYARPPEKVVDMYCSQDFRRCPIFVAYQRTAALGIEDLQKGEEPSLSLP